MGSKSKVSINSENDEDLDQNLWAINWFNLKLPRTYKFYNLIAFPHVKKIGGAPLFKGYVVDIVKGKPEHDREVLLIVKYPSAPAFLKMLSNKLFLLKSILRVRSVRNFVFGFVRAVQAREEVTKIVKYKGVCHYLLFVWEDHKKTRFKTLEKWAEENGAWIFFSGDKTASISRTKDGVTQKQPFFIEQMALVEAPGSGEIEQMLAAKKLERLDASIYKVKRVI